MDFGSFFSGQVTQFWDWNDLKTRFVLQPPLYAHQNLKRAGCKIHSKTHSLALGPLFDYMECKNHRAGVVRLNLGQSLLSNPHPFALSMLNNNDWFSSWQDIHGTENISFFSNNFFLKNYLNLPFFLSKFIKFT